MRSKFSIDERARMHGTSTTGKRERARERGKQKEKTRKRWRIKCLIKKQFCWCVIISITARYFNNNFPSRCAEQNNFFPSVANCISSTRTAKKVCWKSYRFVESLENRRRYHTSTGRFVFTVCMQHISWLHFSNNLNGQQKMDNTLTQPTSFSLWQQKKASPNSSSAHFSESFFPLDLKHYEHNIKCSSL